MSYNINISSKLFELAKSDILNILLLLIMILLQDIFVGKEFFLILAFDLKNSDKYYS